MRLRALNIACENWTLVTRDFVEIIALSVQHTVYVIYVFLKAITVNSLISLTFLNHFTWNLLQSRSFGSGSYELFSYVFLKLVFMLITFHFLRSCCACHNTITFSLDPDMPSCGRERSFSEGTLLMLCVLMEEKKKILTLQRKTVLLWIFRFWQFQFCQRKLCMLLSLFSYKKYLFFVLGIVKLLSEVWSIVLPLLLQQLNLKANMYKATM